MNLPKTPPQPLPEPLRGSDPDSFARYSVIERLPQIGRRILAENDFPPPVAAQIEELLAGIPEAPVRLLVDSPAPDLADWNTYIRQYSGSNWLEVPWFFAENYFFRRVLEATGYFQPGPGFQADPYAYQKRQGLEVARQAIRALCANLERFLNEPNDPADSMAAFLHADLWGNQADLSLWPADGEAKPDHADLHQAQDFLLVDDSQPAVSLLLGRAPRLDFLVDNAGFELVGDLCLADFCLSHPAFQAPDRGAEVRFHLKSHPTYVSDTIESDVQGTLEWLADDFSSPVRSLARRLSSHLEGGHLVLLSDWFWTSPLPAWQMPAARMSDLAQSSLVISKGDANYRRLLGDLHWPFTIPFGEVLRYFPSPLLALRTHKAEVAAGLGPGQVEILDRRDPEWRVNGRWGVIQLYRPGA